MTTTPQRLPALSLPRRANTRTFNMVTPLLDRHVDEGRGDRPAVHLADRTITYSELQAEVNRAGNALLAEGVEPEHRVAILLHDGLEFLSFFLGALKIGAVPVPLNTQAVPDDLAFFITDSRARALVVEPDVLRNLEMGIHETGPALLLKVVFVNGAIYRTPTLGPRAVVRQVRPALANASPYLVHFPTSVNEPCYWLYSSGTTGRPKGTVHLHGDMLACVAPYAAEVAGITPDDVTFSVAKLFFSYGLVNSLFLPLLAGASVALTPNRPEPHHLLEVVQRHKPTLYFSVPTSYAQVCAALERGEGGDRPFESVRLAVSAGEPLPAPLYDRWRALTGVELLDGIGSTEVGYIYVSNLTGQVRPGASGKPIGDHEIRIVGEDGEDAGPDDAGELWVKAVSTALYYWNRRLRTKSAFVGEWLRTGDRYRRDEDGYLYYLGRASDVFKVSGQWVSPTEVESCIIEHPAVLEAAVVAATDDAGLVKPKAFVVLRPGASVTAQELQAHVRERLLPHKYPRWVEFVDSLPKTASGKIQRFRLRGE